MLQTLDIFNQVPPSHTSSASISDLLAASPGAAVVQAYGSGSGQRSMLQARCPVVPRCLFAAPFSAALTRRRSQGPVGSGGESLRRTFSSGAHASLVGGGSLTRAVSGMRAPQGRSSLDDVIASWLSASAQGGLASREAARGMGTLATGVAVLPLEVRTPGLGGVGQAAEGVGRGGAECSGACSSAGSCGAGVASGSSRRHSTCASASGIDGGAWPESPRPCSTSGHAPVFRPVFQETQVATSVDDNTTSPFAHVHGSPVQEGGVVAGVRQADPSVEARDYGALAAHASSEQLDVGFGEVCGAPRDLFDDSAPDDWASMAALGAHHARSRRATSSTSSDASKIDGPPSPAMATGATSPSNACCAALQGSSARVAPETVRTAACPSAGEPSLRRAPACGGSSPEGTMQPPMRRGVRLLKRASAAAAEAGTARKMAAGAHVSTALRLEPLRRVAGGGLQGTRVPPRVPHAAGARPQGPSSHHEPAGAASFTRAGVHAHTQGLQVPLPPPRAGEMLHTTIRFPRVNPSRQVSCTYTRGRLLKASAVSSPRGVPLPGIRARATVEHARDCTMPHVASSGGAQWPASLSRTSD
jgi:hypothetical protein